MTVHVGSKISLGLVGGCLLALSAQVQGSNLCSALPEPPGVIEVSQGLQQEVQLPVPVLRLAVGDPEVAELQLTGRQSFLITGRGAGVTNISVWTRCATAPRQSMLFVQGPAASALVQPVRSVQDDAALPSQVQTDIRFVEVNRSKLKAMGISILGTGSSNFLFGSPGTSPVGVPIGGVGDLTPGLNLPLPTDGFNIVWGGGSSRVLGALNALENSGFAYTLARPSLVALSGQSASFLAGGEFPVPIPSAGSDTVSIQYKEFGVRLSLTPTVVSRDRITLKVAPEVSELDFANGISIESITVPALNVRRTDTTVSLADGESFVISGLISTRTTSAVDKFPGLGDLPILGAFFRSSRIDRDERELLMVVTPRLVHPMAANAQLPELPGEALRRYDPSAFELLLFENGEFDRRPGYSR